MITSEQIRRKAENLYHKVLSAWLDDDGSFFPRVVPVDRSLDKHDLPAAIESIDCLRDGSKEVLGYGYKVEWSTEKKSRKFGLNRFPERILFETRPDLLRLIRRTREFDSFTGVVSRLRSEFGGRLDQWIRSHIRILYETEPVLENLILVVKYFRQHPRPNIFARELPLPIDTKFIERHKRILNDWFDVLLLPEAIRADETHFERRYGLRYAEPLILLRTLDPQLQRELKLPFSELALPLSTLASVRARDDMRVFVVENKVSLLTLLTLPNQRRSLALGALGSAVTILRDVRWLARVPMFYWGDIDVEGLKILSDVRRLFPHVKSFLMDEATLERWSKYIVDGTGAAPEEPALLTQDERAAFHRCRSENLRLEQEHIPQPIVDATIEMLL